MQHYNTYKQTLHIGWRSAFILCICTWQMRTLLHIQRIRSSATNIHTYNHCTYVGEVSALRSHICTWRIKQWPMMWRPQLETLAWSWRTDLQTMKKCMELPPLHLTHDNCYTQTSHSWGNCQSLESTNQTLPTLHWSSRGRRKLTGLNRNANTRIWIHPSRLSVVTSSTPLKHKAMYFEMCLYCPLRKRGLRKVFMKQSNGVTTELSCIPAQEL